eukprot:Skav214599  [mRNA]  locus=scaffold57:552264:559149:- [translate_table: standard]
MLSAIFCFLVGTGIGAYNAEKLRPCLGDTGTVVVEKSKPMAKQFSARVSQHAQPYVQMAQDKINELRGRK